MTLTFFFSDIEDSSGLAARLGEALRADARRMPRASARMRSSGGRTRGDSRGDGLFCVFELPEPAVSAALETQRAFAAREWSGGERVVRIGLHCGDAEAFGGG